MSKKTTQRINTSGGGGTNECYYCHQTGHKKAKCPTLLKRKMRECYYCHETGHVKARCPALKAKMERTCNACGEKGHVHWKCSNRGTLFMHLKPEFLKDAEDMSKVKRASVARKGLSGSKGKGKGKGGGKGISGSGSKGGGKGNAFAALAYLSDDEEVEDSRYGPAVVKPSEPPKLQGVWAKKIGD